MARKRTPKPSSKPSSEIKITEVPLAQPSRTKPTGKTLIDIVEENRPRHGDDSDSEEVIGPLGEAIFYTVPLAMLLFGLDVLVHQQYRQEIEYKMVFWRVMRAVPVIFLLLRTFHPRRTWLTVQLLFLTISVVTGCWVVRSVNRYGYYAVMKRTPPLGTLWIWSVVELNLVLALVSCGAVGYFTWYYGYSLL